MKSKHADGKTIERIFTMNTRRIRPPFYASKHHSIFIVDNDEVTDIRISLLSPQSEK